MRSFPLSLLPVILLAAAPAHAATTALDLLAQFNIVTGDYNMNGETEGAVFVSGAYNPLGTHQVAFNAGTAVSDTQYVLWLNNGVTDVGGTGHLNVQSGSVISRVAVNAADFTLNGNAPGNPIITMGEASWSDTLSSQLGLSSAADAGTLLQGTSIFWRSLPANSNTTLTVSALGTKVNFVATPALIDGKRVAIFDFPPAALGGDVSEFDLVLNGAEAVLINVPGTSVTMNKNFVGSFINNEHLVLFNFYEATQVTLTTGFRGAVFAPGATVIATGSNIDGNVVSATLTQNAEVHSHPFTGPLPVPEPSTALLAALGATVPMRRRRRIRPAA